MEENTPNKYNDKGISEKSALWDTKNGSLNRNKKQNKKKTFKGTMIKYFKSFGDRCICMF
jgi:hypothetical protein